MVKVAMIAAMSQDRVIGINNQLPWHIREDLRRFKQLTMGHVMIMGRKTFESIGKPLPGRVSVVLTRDKTWSHEGVYVYHSIEAMLADLTVLVGYAVEQEQVFAIGGEQIYRQLLPMTEVLYLTEVAQVVEGDAFFPVFEEAFVEAEREEHEGFAFVRYARTSTSYDCC